ncbi:MAG TPA: FGGY family carbohydrate kinase [Bacillales bacterium]|nr:FGGY family carbohydrate kinase [Bacillales bacterium]
MRTLLGVDIGTTHCKAGLFSLDGSEIEIVTKETLTHYDSDGNAYYKPEEIWKRITCLMKEATEKHDQDPMVVGITSMAETGVLVDPSTGLPKSQMIPWFDKRTVKQAELIGRESDAFSAFQKTGLHNSYKYGLAKLLWLEEKEPGITKGAVWLSAADYIAYRLTGKMATDYSLAARTFAFRIDNKEWDDPWLRHFGFDPELFPTASPSGEAVGNIPTEEFRKIGLAKGTPVAVSGHDHVCAASAVGALNPGIFFDSIGTAETLVGTLNEWNLGEKEFRSGLSFGCHVAAGRYFWMGSLPSSGGSIEWFRKQFSDDVLSYQEMNRLLEGTDSGPTGILYYPYLSGSGSTHRHSEASASFVGMNKTHRKGDLLKAVLEGTAFEMESIRRVAEETVHSRLNELIAVGGGTKNRTWMQIKADVSNCTLSIPAYSEATLLGAAVVAGIGCGVYADEEEAMTSLRQSKSVVVRPNLDHHQAYRKMYETGYKALEEPLFRYFGNLAGERNE